MEELFQSYSEWSWHMLYLVKQLKISILNKEILHEQDFYFYYY